VQTQISDLLTTVVKNTWYRGEPMDLSRLPQWSQVKGIIQSVSLT